jgi:hypothetical protein
MFLDGLGGDAGNGHRGRSDLELAAARGSRQRVEAPKLEGVRVAAVAHHHPRLLNALAGQGRKDVVVGGLS